MPVFDWESFAIVADGDLDEARNIGVQCHQDLSPIAVFSKRVNALRRILQHVRKRLRDEAAIEISENRRLRQPLLEIDVRTANPHQEDRLAHAIGQVVTRRAGFRHPRKRGKFVDHTFDVVDLADDGVGALVENGLAFEDVPAVPALEPLGRELDRGQRILDFVRDAAGDVGPRRRALRGDEIADVVEGDDARPIVPSRISGDPNVENAFAAVPQDSGLPLMEAQPQRTRLLPDEADAVLHRSHRQADEAAVRRPGAARRRRSRW